MPDLPPKEFQPEETDQAVRLYGKSLGQERKQSLMDKLSKEREAFTARKEADLSNDQSQERGRQR